MIFFFFFATPSYQAMLLSKMQHLYFYIYRNTHILTLLQAVQPFYVPYTVFSNPLSPVYMQLLLCNNRKVNHLCQKLLLYRHRYVVSIEWESRVMGKSLFNAFKWYRYILIFFLTIKFSKNSFPS
jgi:hypothetical protein